MIPLRGALWTLGAAVAALLLWYGYGKYGSYQDAKERAWQVKVDSLSVLKAHADTVYDTARVGYITYRDRILRSGTATPRDSVTFKKADAVVFSCDTLKIRGNQLVSVMQDKPSGVRRVQAYGEALYDVAHSVPVLRAGATAKVFGPVSLSVAGEYAAPRAGNSDPAFRALTGLRINF